MQQKRKVGMDINTHSNLSLLAFFKLLFQNSKPSFMVIASVSNNLDFLV